MLKPQVPGEYRLSAYVSKVSIHRKCIMQKEKRGATTINIYKKEQGVRTGLRGLR